MYSYVRITIRRHLDRSLWLWETIAAFVVPISLRFDVNTDNNADADVATLKAAL